MTKSLAGNLQVLLKPMRKVKEWTVTLTFNPGTWILVVTHCLIMIIICAKLFSNPTMHNKVMGPTRTGFTEINAQRLSGAVTLTFDLATWFLFGTHRLVMMIFCAKLLSNLTMQNSYGLDMNRFH